MAISFCETHFLLLRKDVAATLLWHMIWDWRFEPTAHGEEQLNYSFYQKGEVQTNWNLAEACSLRFSIHAVSSHAAKCPQIQIARKIRGKREDISKILLQHIAFLIIKVGIADKTLGRKVLKFQSKILSLTASWRKILSSSRRLGFAEALIVVNIFIDLQIALLKIFRICSKTMR